MVPFNFKRCMRLAGDLLVENKKSFLLLWAIPVLALTTVIVLMGVTSGSYSREHYYYSSNTDPMLGPNGFLMVATFVMMCCIAASRGLSNTSTKQMSIQSLMLPVSEKERYIARFLLYVPMYTVAFAVGIVLVECIRYGLISVFYPHSPYLHFMFTKWFLSEPVFWCIVFYFIGVQSFFFLSGAIWPKIGMVFAFVFFVSIVVLNVILMAIVLNTGGEYYDYFPDTYTHDWSYTNIMRFNVALSVVFCLISCGINYVLAYFRCKEREIINRW